MLRILRISPARPVIEGVLCPKTVPDRFDALPQVPVALDIIAVEAAIRLVATQFFMATRRRIGKRDLDAREESRRQRRHKNGLQSRLHCRGARCAAKPPTATESRISRYADQREGD